MEEFIMKEFELLEVVSETKVLGKSVKLYRSIENPLFEAKEIADWINVQNVSQMLKQADIPESEKGIFLKYTPGGNQKSLFISEDAMYDVLMQSRKNEAKIYRREISAHLKKIRLTGGSIENGMEKKFIEYYLPSISGELKDKIIAELTDTNKELKQFYDDLMNTEGLYHTNMVAKQLKIGRNTMLSYLREKDILFYQDNSNVPYQRFMNQKLFAVVETPCADGKYRPVTYVTKKGLEYIRKLLRKDGFYNNDLATE